MEGEEPAGEALWEGGLAADADGGAADVGDWHGGENGGDVARSPRILGGYEGFCLATFGWLTCREVLGNGECVVGKMRVGQVETSARDLGSGR